MRKCDKICMGVCDKGEKFKENKSKKEEEPKKNLLTRMSQLLYCIDRVIFWDWIALLPLYKLKRSNNPLLLSCFVDLLAEKRFQASKYHLIGISFGLTKSIAISKFSKHLLLLLLVLKGVKTCLTVNELVRLFICLYPQYLKGKEVIKKKTFWSEWMSECIHTHISIAYKQESTANEHKTYNVISFLLFFVACQTCCHVHNDWVSKF